MTQIDFYTHIENPLYYSCRLACKVYQNQKKLLIFAQQEQLFMLDEALWTFSELVFLPHCQLHDRWASKTPIILTTTLEAVPHYEVLLNLSFDRPLNFSRFNRVLEVVSTEASALVAARDRYRFYRDQGYSLRLYQKNL